MSNPKDKNKQLSHLSHTSAAIQWEIPYLHTVLGYPSWEALIESQTLNHRCYYQRITRRVEKGEVRHVRSLALPKNSLRMVNGEVVSSPELVFLELSKELNFHQRVLLGIQLCSSSPNDTPPLTTTRKLKRFINACPYHGGYKVAVNALRYIVDNSWSIMESLLYMLLTLPNSYGGFGLTGAKLNQSIVLPKKGGWQKTNKVFADLYWEAAKLVVEYDSIEFHNSALSWTRDSQRQVTLERNGFKSLSVTTAQIYSDNALAEVAQLIAKHLNKRIRIRTPKYVQQKAILRGMLPRGTESLLQ